MADFTKPELTSSYTDFITELKARDNTISSLFSDGTTHVGNYPARAVAWNSTNSYFERRNANNDGWERLEGNSGTHKFVNVEAGNITGTGTILGDDVTATDQLQAGRINVTGATVPANGLYRPSANEIRLTTGSSDRLTIESNGEVGINTVDPQQRLHVLGNARIENGNANTVLEIGENNSNTNRNAEIRLIGDPNRTGVNAGLRIIRTNGGANASTELIHRGTGQFILEANEAADILFKTTNITRVSIANNGFVGFGNFEASDPSHNLHIKRGDNAGNYIRLENSEGSAYLGADGDSLILQGDATIFKDEVGSNRAFINANGFAIGGDNTHLVKLFVASTGTTYSDPSNNNVAGAYIYNSTNNNSNAHAYLAVRSTGSGGGDPFISFDINGVVGWHIGIDNSDSDKFKIGKAWNAVGANTALTIDSSYNAVFSATVSATSFSGNGASVTNVNATTLDGIDSGSFLRSDANDTCSGIINFSGRKIGLGTTPGGTLVNRNAALAMGDNDTGIAQNGDGQLELWANNVEVVNIDSGQVIFYGHAVPGAQVDLGTSSNPWRNLYINEFIYRYNYLYT